MVRRLVEGRLVLASHNAGKLAELQELLAGRAVEVIPAAALGLAEPVEDGATFAANASIKAHAAARTAGRPALADDSGLVAHGLEGRPGVHIARRMRGGAISAAALAPARGRHPDHLAAAVRLGPGRQRRLAVALPADAVGRCRGGRRGSLRRRRCAAVGRPARGEPGRCERPAEAGGEPGPDGRAPQGERQRRGRKHGRSHLRDLVVTGRPASQILLNGA